MTPDLAPGLFDHGRGDLFDEGLAEDGRTLLVSPTTHGRVGSVRLQQLYVRFFKSLNYDYEFKARHPDQESDWQKTDQGWLPHIRIQFEPDVTAIVGANESGKSQMLDAIEILLGEAPNLRRGFCRYSPLYSVEDGRRRLPEFAADMRVETDLEEATLEAIGLEVATGDTFFFCRPGAETPYVADRAGGNRIELDTEQLTSVEGAFPKVFRLRTDVELPEVVPIRDLVPDSQSARVPTRSVRNSLLRLLGGLDGEQAVAAHAAEIAAELNNDEEVEGAALARSLLTEVANIAPDSFLELSEALDSGAEGEVAGLIEQMNASISRHLNLQRWWTQDGSFELTLSLREHEIAFAVRDRTGTVYSISERSRGLKFFLAYFIHLRTHDRPAGRRELVLIDEPDAYLSAAGQQDLLRLIEDYSSPASPADAQTIYVTHSPFLINKNASQRIRVIEKGVGEEGTRIIKAASHNRYEPLRTAMGAFVAETAFIGGSNLFVEGPADQIMLAGMSSYLLRQNAPPTECLDLNKTTVVPSGGADSVPYMTYLARGRGEVKPPCVALLDGDASGRSAIARLKKIEANNKRVLADEFIVDLAEWALTCPSLELTEGVRVRELEDLVPVQVAVQVMRRYAYRLLGLPEASTQDLTAAAVTDALGSADGAMWDACAEVFEKVCGESLEKVGFAREVIDFANEPASGRNRPAGIPALQTNFSCLIRHLADLLWTALRVEQETRRARRLDRTVDGFLSDFPDTCTRDRASLMLREIESVADETDAGDALLAASRAMQRDFGLAAEPLQVVPSYPAFVDRLKQLKYLGRDG